MSRDRVRISVKVVNGVRWGDLSVIGSTHEFCGERVDCKDPCFSFAGGHRVKLYVFKKNVYWKIPEGADYDISAVAPAEPPRRNQRLPGR